VPWCRKEQRILSIADLSWYNASAGLPVLGTEKFYEYLQSILLAQRYFDVIAQAASPSLPT